MVEVIRTRLRALILTRLNQRMVKVKSSPSMVLIAPGVTDAGIGNQGIRDILQLSIRQRMSFKEQPVGLK